MLLLDMSIYSHMWIESFLCQLVLNTGSGFLHTMNFILKTVKQIHIIETNKRVFHDERKKNNPQKKK